MKSSYYVNDRAQPTGEHEVHKQGCYYLGLAHSTTYLGMFYTCQEAVATAKYERYNNSDGCAHCSPACHKR